MAEPIEGDGIRPVALPGGRVGYALEYEIVFGPVEEEGVGPTPELDAESDDLYERLMADPASTVGRLEELVGRYPQVPSLKNWLSVAYIAAKRNADAEALADVLVRDHPNYLFGRLAVADRHLRAGDLDRVLEPLGGQADLKLIYPHRSRFHVSEAIALWRLVGELSLRRGEVEQARMYLSQMERFDPDHAMTRLLANRIASAVVLQGLERLRSGNFGRRRPATGKKTKKKSPRRKR